MEQLQRLWSGRNGDVEPQHKDKLAHSKQVEREAHDYRKAAAQEEKNRRKQDKKDELAAYKEVRHLNGTSKRCAREEREEAKREKRRENGQMCEHGVWKCQICFPHKTTK
uniref:Uncharacterized protein n=1 Tax=Tetraselmis chuii TaxID=63592 RepID=A0A7S1T4A6_9CHLO|mmetsp:Transcript_5699/g.10232  ORF Transcript_5699/g.10232 Transcript_5699/m.10232 type:complete len:110 (+) Transcript_5699:336-665(+)